MSGRERATVAHRAEGGPYRFFFYSADHDEPPHVHVERDDGAAKFWLEPVRLQRNIGFHRVELRQIERLVEEHAKELLGRGMSTSRVEMEVPSAESVSVAEDTLMVDLSDGRSLSVPLAWYPRLLHATSEERTRWRLIGRGQGIRWEALDEDVSVEGLLAGRASGESQGSFRKWLEQRRSTK